jgi:crotonobetainyl-CoA:carnitine CoA-transferase CaiB-like acyl-CoA transferase
MSTGPLEGVRVIDLTVVWSGPGATVLLGDLGAEVIKIECTTRATRGIGNMTREVADRSGYLGASFPDRNPEPRAFNRTATMNGWHGRNKLSVTMPPLETPAGREAFLRLVAVSDVVIENNSAKVMPKLGLDYEDLKAINPRIIMVRMAPLELDGPMRDCIGYGPNFNALVGIAAMDGYDGDEPTTAGENYHMDESSPAGAAFAVMAALWERERSGEGQLVQFAQAENLLPEVGEYVLDVQVNARKPEIEGNAHPLLVQNVFTTADVADDRWLALTIRNADEWSRLTDIMGAAAPAVTFEEARGMRAGDPVFASIDAWTSSLPVNSLVDVLGQARIPAAEVLTEMQVLADGHLADRDWFQTRSHPETGEHAYLGHPWRANGFESAWGRPFAALGEDNEYVYKTVMGIDDAYYEAGIQEGFIGTDLKV